MLQSLNIYKDHDSFIFKVHDNLKIICNAPTNKSGIYIFFDGINDESKILYIGCSGHIQNDGSIHTRTTGQGGIYGRIVYGHQFGKVHRWKSLPLKMKQDNINELMISWFVTYDESIKHSPCFVESCLIQDYYNNKGVLPKWNNKF